MFKIKLSTVLSIVSFVGVAVTGYLAARGGKKAAEIENELEEYSLDEATTGRKLKATWKCYIPAIAAGIVTIGCGAYAKRLDTKEIVKLTGALGVASDRLSKLMREYDIYRGEVVGEVGRRKEQEIYQRTTEKLRAGYIDQMVEGVYAFHIDWCGGKHMFFESTKADITKAMYEMNRRLNDTECIENGYSDPTVSDFFYELGLNEMTNKDTDNACWDTEECQAMDNWWIHWDIVPYGKSDYEIDKKADYYDIQIDMYPNGSKYNELRNAERFGTM